MPAPTTLRVRHVPNSDPPRFYVERSDGKSTAAAPAEVPPPTAFPVDGRPGSHLSAELRWYLEVFLDYPFPPETEHADRVLAALRRWGEQAFNALFDNRQAGRWLEDAAAGGYERVLLQIWSDDPRILAWPWEALRDPQASVLAATCRIERHLNRVLDPVAGEAPAPADRVNILLVIARPLEGDVKYRSIARPLVELIASRGLPARVHVLRPPTFDALRRHLAAHPGEIHLVHFDGHGAYAAAPPLAGAPHAFSAPQGRLLFEKDDGGPAPVDAETLSALLREHRVPAVVLNACQSAMIDERAADPFASVAAALLGAGMRSVVAMSYKLYVSGAREFLPAFYERLFETGSFAEGSRAGRQRMYAERGRVCARGRFPLEDWLVPVLYQQQEEGGLTFAAGDRPPLSRPALPEEVERDDSPYGFIGRDGPLLAIERALRQPTPAILLHGLGGIGKTTLAKGLVRWLAATDGLGQGCLWLSFQDIRSAEYVLNRLGEPLFGPGFAAAPPDQKVGPLAKALRELRLLIVWDNFEVVCGAAGFEATLSEADRGLLRALLQGLRGGKTKVVITSRSEEAWLGPELRRKIAVGGLDQEERWELCETILRELGLKVDRKDRDQVELMELLGGHPLAMRVVLLRLGEGQRAGELVRALRSNLHALGGEGDEAQRKLYATLKLAEDALPEELKPLLVPLGMHEGYVEANHLQAMASHVDEQWTRAQTDRFLELLANSGLLRRLEQAVYEMHPALTGFLQATVLSGVPEEKRDQWSRIFVGVMGCVAKTLASLPLHEQHVHFARHGASFHRALPEAERLKLQKAHRGLLWGLGFYSRKIRRFSEATSLLERLAKAQELAGDAFGEVAAYHELGIAASERRDFDAAALWHKKSIDINEILGNEQALASTYHELGILAQELRDFDAAKLWHQKSLAISEKLSNDQDAADAYHELGIVAQERQDFDAAELYYKKSLAIQEKHRNEQKAAITYHQLGRVAEERGDLDAAEVWHKKSLAIEEKYSNEHAIAITYHHFGMIAQKKQDFDVAESWYKKSLAIKEKQSDEHGAAKTYNHLAMIAQERRDLALAEIWLQKSLFIKEKEGDEQEAANIYGRLGILEGMQSRYEEAGCWFIKSIRAFMHNDDLDGAIKGAENFLIAYTGLHLPEQTKLRSLWESAGLGRFPEDAGPSESP